MLSPIFREGIRELLPPCRQLVGRIDRQIDRQIVRQISGCWKFIRALATPKTEPKIPGRLAVAVLLDQCIKFGPSSLEKAGEIFLVGQFCRPINCLSANCRGRESTIFLREVSCLWFLFLLACCLIPTPQKKFEFKWKISHEKFLNMALDILMLGLVIHHSSVFFSHCVYISVFLAAGVHS